MFYKKFLIAFYFIKLNHDTGPTIKFIIILIYWLSDLFWYNFIFINDLRIYMICMIFLFLFNMFHVLNKRLFLNFINYFLKPRFWHVIKPILFSIISFHKVKFLSINFFTIIFIILDNFEFKVYDKMNDYLLKYK